MKIKKRALSIFLKILAALLAVILAAGCAFGIAYAEQATRDNTTLGPVQTKYYTDETGNRIANIPYDDYACTQTVPDDAKPVDGLSENNDAAKNTAALQTAIDTLSAAGGGTVYVQPGTYKIGSVCLKDNITLYLDKGAELASLTYDENQAAKDPLAAGVLYAENAKNITITGGGTINGMGETYTNPPKEETPLYALKNFNTYTRVIEARKRIREAKSAERPNVLNLYKCENVTVDGIILKDAASWTFVLSQCSNVQISNLVIDNSMHVANSDGIDIAGGEAIAISHCFIATGDDGIVLKPSEAEIHNVTVEDCTIASYANCFKIGTETQMDVSNVQVRNCTFFLPNGITGGYSGIAIESCDGSNVSDVTVSNITMEGISSPLLIWLGSRLQYDKDTVGSINGVTIQNVTATDTEMPSAITGCVADGETHYVQNVTLENIRVTYRDTGEDLHIRRTIGEYTMSGYPDITRVSHIYFLNHELSKYWDLPCYGIAIKHAEAIDYADYSVTPRTCNDREMLYIDDVK